jgi:uncharacterized protein (TIGR03118 family)
MRTIGIVKWMLPCAAFLIAGCDSNNDNNDPPQRLKETRLVSDQSNVGAAVTDPNLVNAWGLAFNPTNGFIWVSDAETGLATVYQPDGTIVPLVVTIPTPNGVSPPSSPTGQVFNSSSGFMGDKFIFSTENGTIAGWQANSTAALRVPNSTTGAIYKGLAIATQNGTTRLYATDFHNGKVDTFDSNYAPVALSNGFVNSAIPAGFAPFGIQAVGTTIYVTYAKQDADAEDDLRGVGNGFVAVYDFDGKLQNTLISNGLLNSPWGIAVAPADFGNLSNQLLIGNFGDGRINAYDRTSGAFLSTVQDESGAPLFIDGLWALEFGTDVAGESHNQLFFTAGPGAETHGLLGRLDIAPASGSGQ